MSTYIIRLKDGSWQRYESRHKNRDAVVKEILTRCPDADYIEAMQQVATPNVTVKFNKLRPDAVKPIKAHPTDAGYDLTATSRVVDNLGNVVYGFGLAFEIPVGYVGLLCPRSSICDTDLTMTGSIGIIDCDYRGEVTMKFRPTPILQAESRRGADLGFAYLKDAPTLYQLRERIGQLIIIPIPSISFIESDTLSETDRGTGGYGSSGK